MVTPERFQRNTSEEMVFVNRTTWMDVPRDDEAFMNLLGEVVTLLDAPVPPDPLETCETCNYRASMQDFKEL